jgi:hypothetical protein
MSYSCDSGSGASFCTSHLRSAENSITPAMCLVFQGRDRSGVFMKNIPEIENDEAEPLIDDTALATANLERWVSAERLAPYRNSAHDACALYAWNARVASGLFEMIGHAEILLRNVLHTQLTLASREAPWFDDPAYRFTSRSAADIAAARRRVERTGRAAAPGRVVAELPFGFWRFLLASTYQTTIWPRVASGFCGVPRSSRSRSEIEGIVARLHLLRNRVAHHEPVFESDLPGHFRDVVRLAELVEADAGRWFRDISRVEALLAERPL